MLFFLHGGSVSTGSNSFQFLPRAEDVNKHQKARRCVEVQLIWPCWAPMALRMRVSLSFCRGAWAQHLSPSLSSAPGFVLRYKSIAIPLQFTSKIVQSLVFVKVQSNLLKFSAEETGTIVSCTFVRNEAEPFYRMSHYFMSPYYGFSYLSLHNIPRSTLLKHRPDAAVPLGMELLLLPAATEIPSPTVDFSAASLHLSWASSGLLRRCLSDGQELLDLQ